MNKICRNLVIVFILVITLGEGSSLAHAQMEDDSSDSPTMIPSSAGGPTSAPPIIMDESDSGGVSEVDEYDN